MFLKLLGFLDVTAGLSFLFLPHDTLQGISFFFGMYLILKGLIFFRSFVSLLDMVCGGVMLLALVIPLPSLFLLFALWPIQKGLVTLLTT